jgi:hypothetical protein
MLPVKITPPVFVFVKSFIISVVGNSFPVVIVAVEPE